MEGLTKLYSSFIKEQNERPFHFGKKPEAQFILKAYNPVCGDRFEIFIGERSSVSQEIHFHGFGCAISKASTSMMAKTLSGKSNQDALALCNEFLAFMDKKIDTSGLTLGNDFTAFAGVHDFPERYECVVLSWLVMKEFLESQPLM